MKIATKEVLRSVSFEETYDHVGVNNSTKIVGFSSNGKFVKFAPIVSERGTTEPGNWGVPYETKGEKFSETITRFQDETGLTPDTLHVVETWRGMDFGDEVSVEYKILPSLR